MTPSKELSRLFPFYLIADKDGKIIETGPSLKKLLSVDSDRFEEHFAIKKPAGISYGELLKLENEMIVLHERRIAADLMGQIMCRDDNQTVLFALSLVVQTVQDVKKLNLTFNDFAIQDQTFDFMMLVQAHRRSLEQADKLNRKLIVANKEAIRASEMKSQFLANMSHELRTPMNGVIGLASVMQEMELEEAQVVLVENIIRSGEHMVSLVNDILDLSKIEAGHIELDQREFDLRKVIEDIHQTLSVIARKKGIDFEIDIENDLEVVVGDPIRLRQIFFNLAGNAIKFTDKGSVHLSVIALQQPNGKVLIQGRVKDTGIGMDETTLKQIFSPFIQGDSSMTKKYEGTGLGLSICKRLVTAMDGNITVVSTLGDGTEFTVDLKLKQKSAA